MLGVLAEPQASFDAPFRAVHLQLVDRVASFIGVLAVWEAFQQRLEIAIVGLLPFDGVVRLHQWLSGGKQFLFGGWQQRPRDSAEYHGQTGCQKPAAFPDRAGRFAFLLFLAEQLLQLGRVGDL